MNRQQRVEPAFSQRQLNMRSKEPRPDGQKVTDIRESIEGVRPFPVWDAEVAGAVIGKYCMVQANYVDEDENFLVAEQFHGVVAGTHPVRGVWFRLKGQRDGEDWVGPPDFSLFQLPPGKGEFTLSETGEVVTDPDYIIMYTFYDSNSLKKQ